VDALSSWQVVFLALVSVIASAVTLLGKVALEKIRRNGSGGISPETRERLHDIEEREQTFITAINMLEHQAGLDLTRLPPRRAR
jgi:hypothetical protein